MRKTISLALTLLMTMQLVGVASGEDGVARQIIAMQAPRSNFSSRTNKPCEASEDPYPMPASTASMRIRRNGRYPVKARSFRVWEENALNNLTAAAT
jgi:hypothetical protein